MLSDLSVCGLGSVGCFFALGATNFPSLHLRLHSLSTSNSCKKLHYGDIQSPYSDIVVEDLSNLCSTIFLVCDVSRITSYLSAILNSRAGAKTTIYLFQNGLVELPRQFHNDTFIVHRISLGNISLSIDGNVLSNITNSRPIFELSALAKSDLINSNLAAYSFLNTIGDASVVDSENIVIWNKLVRSGFYNDHTLQGLHVWKCDYA